MAESNKTLEDELNRQLGILAVERKGLSALQRKLNRVAGSPIEGNDEKDIKRRQLVTANRKLRQTLERLKRKDAVPGSSPQLINVRNKITAAWKEVEQVEQEVETLLLLQRDRNKVLEQKRKGDHSVVVLQGKQREEQHHLRAKLRELESKLKKVEKKDVMLRNRFTQLQNQVLLNVTEKDVTALKNKHMQQMKTIAKLQKKREEQALSWSKTVQYDGQRLTIKEKKAKIKMEKEIAGLQALVLERNEEILQLNSRLARIPVEHF
ncbi:hypothetical protein MOQ_001298 [Trypanosoma cruzi marinkellei]|uniref:DUF4201 domain-containing protein n=1 Tax=Trypanosoma cruzi marinkellei TaxID=85056 RepID=K2NL56_TRYCR|nr:hypothetical protein MOQ_001298 [Trypanosoma cruzi marinkellei]